MIDLNKIQIPQLRAGIHMRTGVSLRAMQRWDSSLRAEAKDERTISILDVIGEDFWTGEGVTAKRIAGALRSLGAGPVTVSINSPGGDLYDGLAIYNMLREHDGEVTVKIMGLAASAASVIAMAGDKIEIARAGFYMIHNGWMVVMGNRNDLREIADWMEPFDKTIADVYQERTGKDVKELADMMDAETWIGGNEAVESGFADSLLASDGVVRAQETKTVAAVRRMEEVLRSSGMPKKEAMKLISEVKSSGDTGSGTGDPAGRLAVTADLKKAAQLAASLKSILIGA